MGGVTNIIFMGSAAFAAPAFEKLAGSGHVIIEVVTQPDKPAGRGQNIKACPVAQAARQKGLSLFQPKSVRTPEVIEHFRNFAPDLIVIIAYGKLLPKELLDIPKKGTINVHASLLPKYRGAAPINWAVANGETETGVTTMFVNEELDAGDVILSAGTNIGADETAAVLHDRLALMGADLIEETLELIEKGRAKPVPQDHSKATFAPILKKEDGHIDWSLSARDIHNRVRGLNPWPGTFTRLNDKILKIYGAKCGDINRGRPSGTFFMEDGELAIACGQGVLYPLDVQVEGGKRMSAHDFLLGHKIEKGVVLK